jgi:hypothetical protein
LLGWTTAATFLLFAVLARFPVPYRDDWDWIAWLLRRPPSLASLFEPQGPHVIPLARALLWFQIVIEGVNGHVLFLAALAAELIVVTLFWRAVRVRWAADPVVRRAASGALLLLLCFNWQLQSLVFPAAVLFPLVQAFATLSIFSVVRATSVAGVRRHAWQALGLAASMLAMLATTNGIAVPATAAVVSGVRRSDRSVGLAHLALAFGGMAAFAWLVLRVRAVGATAELGSFAQWPAVATYFLAFFAPFLTFGSGAAGAAVGFVLVSAGCLVIARVRRSGARAPEVERFAMGLMGFVMASAVLAALARAAEFGVGQASQSRYATLTVTYWASLALAAMSLVSRGEAPPVIARLRGSAELVAVPAAALLLAFHILTGVVWTAKAGNVATAALALKVDAHDEQWIRSLHPTTAVVFEVAKEARARGDRTLDDENVGRHIAVAPSLPDCDASLVATPAPVGPAIRLTGTVGWAAESGWILDDAGVVAGLAARAPVVDTADPRPGDVVAAVGRAIRRRPAASGTPWLGFVPASAARPFRFVGVSNGAPACQSPVSWSATSHGTAASVAP